MSDYKPQRIGANPPQAVASLRSDASEAVLSACGVPVSLVTDADGTSQREAWRRFIMGSVEPLLGMVVVELEAKLETRVTFDLSKLWAHDLAISSPVVVEPYPTTVIRGFEGGSERRKGRYVRGRDLAGYHPMGIGRSLAAAIAPCRSMAGGTSRAARAPVTRSALRSRVPALTAPPVAGFLTIRPVHRRPGWRFMGPAL